MEGIRLNQYEKEINNINEQIATLPDVEQLAILHEIIDDTPFKTQNYNKYAHEEYYICHNKPKIIESEKKRVLLKPYKTMPDCDLAKLISGRDSVRDYANKEVTFEQFSTLLHYSFGVKRIARGAYDQREYPFRYCNSAGGLNHLDLYVFVNNVRGLESGIYYYDFINDDLIQMEYGNMRSIIGRLNFQNEFSIYSNFVVAIVSDLSRIVPKYYKRAYRMVHVDAGIALSYLQIIGEYVGVSSCIVAGFLENELERLLCLSRDDYPIATMAFGIKS